MELLPHCYADIRDSMLFPNLQEFAVRLFLPFRLDFDSFPGTKAIWQQLALSGEWVKPDAPPPEASELDPAFRESLFGQKPNGSLYCQGTVAAASKWLGIFPWNGPYALEFFINPQAVGVLAFSCHITQDTEHIPTWSKFRGKLHDQSKNDELEAQAKRWLDGLLPECCQGGATWERRFLITAARFDTIRPFDQDDAQQPEWTKKLIATALALKSSETTIATYENIATEIFGPYHQACVSSHGAAHFFVNSRESTSNPDRVRWVVTNYAWITAHEVLFRCASINLQSASRAKLERFLSLPKDAYHIEPWWTKLQDRLIGGHGSSMSTVALEMHAMHSEVSRFLLFGETILVAKWQTMVQYHSMLRRSLGAAHASGRLRDLLSDMQHALTAQEQNSSMNSLLRLQHGLEFIEPIFLAYYMLMISEHLASQFGIDKGWELLGVVIAVLMGVFARAFPNTRRLLFSFVLFILLWLLLGKIFPDALPFKSPSENTQSSQAH